MWHFINENLGALADNDVGIANDRQGIHIVVIEKLTDEIIDNLELFPSDNIDETFKKFKAKVDFEIQKEKNIDKKIRLKFAREFLKNSHFSSSSIHKGFTLKSLFASIIDLDKRDDVKFIDVTKIKDKQDALFASMIEQLVDCERAYNDDRLNEAIRSQSTCWKGAINRIAQSIVGVIEYSPPTPTEYEYNDKLPKTIKATLLSLAPEKREEIKEELLEAEKEISVENIFPQIEQDVKRNMEEEFPSLKATSENREEHNHLFKSSERILRIH